MYLFAHIATALLAVVAHADDLPRWKQVRLVGQVIPEETVEGVVFRPGKGFACVLRDESKPLSSQDSTARCEDVELDWYMGDGLLVYPPVHSRGGTGVGFNTTWEAWSQVIDRSRTDLLRLTERDGTQAATMTVQLFSAPIKGGCRPRPRVGPEKGGEECLSKHGEVVIDFTPALLGALAARVRRFQSAQPNECVPDLEWCGYFDMLHSRIDCERCSTGACEIRQCRSVKDDSRRIMKEQSAVAARGMVDASSAMSFSRTDLLGLADKLRSPNDALAEGDRTEIADRLSKKMRSIFQGHLNTGNLASARSALDVLVGLEGETQTNAQRRLTLEGRFAAAERAAAAVRAREQRNAASSSRDSLQDDYWRSQPLSARINCVEARCPNCGGEDILDYGADLQRCLSAFEECASNCGCTNLYSPDSVADMCE